MHFFRDIFNSDFEQPEKRIFFVIPPREETPEGSSGKDKKEKPPEKEKPKIPEHRAIAEQRKLRAQIERERATKGLSEETREEKQRLREEIDRTGSAKEYAETFRKSPDFAACAANLETGMQLEDQDTFFNFEKWLVIDPPVLADFFEQFGFMPHGKGRNAFLEGLRLPPDTAQHQESQKALREIVKILREHFEVKRKAREDLKKHAEEGPAGETIDTGVKTLMQNYRRSSGLEKAMILGAIGIGLVLLGRLGKKKFFGCENTKWSDVMWWIAAGFGINFLSGKISKDGKTLVQRLDVGLEIDQLSDENKLKDYAEKHGMKDDQEKLRTFVRLQTIDIKKLFSLYEEAGGPASSAKEIDPRKLGFFKGEIDGKSAYDIIDSLVKETSVNENIHRHKEAALLRGETPQVITGDDLLLWESPGVAMETFKEKYVYGELGELNQTLLDVIINECGTTVMRKKCPAKQDEARLYRQIAAGTVAAAGTLGRGAWEATKGAAEWTWDLGKTGYRIVRDNVAIPFGTWTAAQWNRYAPRVRRGISEAIGWRERVCSSQEAKINKVLPAGFAIDVTENSRATVCGYPGIPFEIATRKDGKEVIIFKLGGKSVEFIVDDGMGGNAARAADLERLVRTQVEALVKARGEPALAGKTPAWDAREKKWKIEKVSAAGDALLGIAGGATTLTFEINPDGRSLKFFDAEKEITNFAQLDIIHRDSVIQEAVWGADSRAEKYLRDLEVHVAEVKTDAVYGARIAGWLGGLAFHAVLKGPGKKISDGLQFFDGRSVGGAEKLAITETNGGHDFLEAQAAKILIDSTYQNAFSSLETLIDNASEGVLARLDALVKKTAMWIIPTSLDVPAGINGRILQRQWKFMLDYKKMETLEFFKQDLRAPRTAVGSIDAVYKTRIVEAIKHLENLSREIQSCTGDEEVAGRFQEFLSGQGSGAAKAPGLEYLNYTNSDYRMLFGEYQRMITNRKYNYPGLESLTDVSISIGSHSWGAADEAFEIYQVLMRVWSYHTRRFATEDAMSGDPKNEIHPDNQRAIRNGIIAQVRRHLENATSAGGGTIHLKDLPPHATDADLDAWVDPSWKPGMARPRQGPRWTGSTAIAAHFAREAAGTVSLREAHEARDVEGQINPTPENLDAIRIELRKIFAETFPTRYASRFRAEFMQKYDRILRDLPEGLMLQAITENGSEKELLKRFRYELGVLRDQASRDHALTEVGLALWRFFKWAVDTKTWDLAGENPHVKSDKIKPQHKAAIAAQMDKLEKLYKKRLEDEYGHWYGDEYDSDQVEFLEKVELPFYRELYMNKTILQNQSPRVLAESYSEFLKKSYRECLEDRVKQRTQEAIDRTETLARSSNPAWTEIYLEMDRIIKV